MAEIIGGAIGVALLGALLAFLMRRTIGASLLPSYLFGVVVAMLIAAALYSYNTGSTFIDALAIYGIAAPIAFALLWLTSRRRVSAP